MENNETQPSELPTQSKSQANVTGSLSDPMTLQRLQAVAKAHKPKGIKAKHVIKTTETVKVASAFGVVSKEVEVEKVVEKTLVGEQKTITTQTPTEAEQDAILRAKLVENGTPEDQIETKLAEAKKVRETLKSLWATDISKTSAVNDRYIDGLPTDGHGVAVNPESGDSGVRMSFKGKPRT